MIRFIADENFDNDIIRGVFRRNTKIDLVRVQDIGLLGANDEDVLDRAANESRILLTHDARTIPKFAFQRIEQGFLMPGVFVVPKDVPVGIVAADILLIAELSLPDEWEGQVRYLPLR